MLDQDLFFAENQRPAIVAGPLNLVYALPAGAYTFPTGFTGHKSIDYQSIVDQGRGDPIYAHFRIATTFSGAALNWLQFCFIVDDNEAMANTNSPLDTARALTVTCGPRIYTANLTAVIGGGPGADWTPPIEVEQVLPALNTIVIPGKNDQGKRFLSLGIVANAPATNWSAGGIDAWLSPHPQKVRSSSYASGY